MIEIRALDAGEGEQQLDELAALLVDAVLSGASVEFMPDVTLDETRAYWTAAVERVAVGRQVLLVAIDDCHVVGTVSVVHAPQQNQPHRADISKLIVSSQHRRQGIADLLMDRAEKEAAARGITLLVLDTVTESDASRVYERRGWHRVGEIPGYAYEPSGNLASTTYYWLAL